MSDSIRQNEFGQPYILPAAGRMTSRRIGRETRYRLYAKLLEKSTPAILSLRFVFRYN
ncbi:hypothetical protein [Saccharibacillus sacchari]|uniref:Uncharacterized protein n=1 Tax=Saccharibacillus sacchari TaxID=456493 RepID=A0ACC6P8S7_9BACL